jgi:hypothetical protein
MKIKRVMRQHTNKELCREREESEACKNVLGAAAAADKKDSVDR